MFKEESKYTAFSKTYEVGELQNLESNVFKSLNGITYPSAETERYPISEEFKTAVYDMAFKVYSKAAKDKTDNFSFSPLGLYENLSVVSLACDDEVANSEIDDLLGLDKAARKENVINAYKSDFFAVQKGKLLMYNGAFFTNQFNVDNGLIDRLSELYVEAYQLDFSNAEGVRSMLDWANGKVGEKNFIDRDFLDIDESSLAFFFTTLDFDNDWSSAFNDTKSVAGTFFASDEERRVTFMRHSYFGECYDYGDYITCYDYYATGLKIKYVVPTEVNGDIFSLVRDNNFIFDDEAQRILPLEDGDFYYDNRIIVNLRLPKFSTEYTFDFSDTLKALGVNEAFNKNGRSFNGAFTDIPEYYSTYIKSVKQKNKAAFSESGTTIKSLTLTQIGKGTAADAPMRVSTINVDLDRPFIYIVYDLNDLPIFIGNVNNI